MIKILNEFCLIGDELSGVNDFCGLIIMEGFKISLLIVVIKVKVRGSLYCIEIDVFLDVGLNFIFCFFEFFDCFGV